MQELTPRQIVAKLDEHIVGQAEAKRAVAIAVRNRWRRQQLSEEMSAEVLPKNILMIGPTGVGKTEIARRFSKLASAPFIKVEATKYTEIGYYGRDIESMIRDLVESAILLVRAEEQEKVLEEAKRKVEERMLDMLCPRHETFEPNLRKGKDWAKDAARQQRRETRNPDRWKMDDPILEKLRAELESRCSPGDLEFADMMREVMEKRMEVGGLGDLGEAMQEIGRLLEERRQGNVLGEAENSFRKVSENASENMEDDEIVAEFSFQDEEIAGVDEGNAEDVKVAAENARRLVEYEKKREETRELLLAGKLEERMVTVPLERKAKSPLMMMNISGPEGMNTEMSDMFENLMPRQRVLEEMSVAEARKVLLEQESRALVSDEKIHARAVELSENAGIIFIDEIDKIVAAEQSHNADVSRQGVQRDMLPLVEGTTVQTRYGLVKTDYILFIAAGAFHRNKPSDLMPELQGRFPIRVELSDLTQEDFERILKEPKNSLLKQYEALLKTEGVEVVFEEDAIRELAAYAWRANQTSQNIGARRLYTILERLLEELSFEAADMGTARVTINAGFVRQRLEDVTKNEELTKYIL